MILIINCGSRKVPLIENIVDEHMDFQSIHISNLQLEDIENKKGIIISGAPVLVTEADMAPYLEKIAFIRDVTIPVLGICFGQQIIALLYGAFASKMKECRDWNQIAVLVKSDLFARLPEEIEMMQDHCETVSVPADFELIATSDDCVNEAMQHRTKPIFGVQFHPEVSANSGAVLLENFIKICEKRF